MSQRRPNTAIDITIDIVTIYYRRLGVRSISFVACFCGLHFRFSSMRIVFSEYIKPHGWTLLVEARTTDIESKRL